MSPAPRVILIEHLRGIAALSVAWFHLTNSYHDFVSVSGELGWLGVEVFFVISGFVIPLSLLSEWEKRGRRASLYFLVRRVIRIEPPYLISVLIVVGLNLIVAQFSSFHGTPLKYSTEQILLHIAYLIPLSRFDWIQPIYWTLSFEFVFYLLMAFVFPIISDFRRKRFIIGAIVVCIASALQLVSPLLPLFVMGCAAFRAHLQLERPVVTFLIITTAAGAMAWAGAVSQSLAGTGTALIILGNGRIHLRWPTLDRIFGFLGTISFSLYLLHVPIGGKIVNFGARWVDGNWGHLAISLLALGGSIIAATLFWAYVERPFIVAARSFSERPGRPRLQSTS